MSAPSRSRPRYDLQRPPNSIGALRPRPVAGRRGAGGGASRRWAGQIWGAGAADDGPGPTAGGGGRTPAHAGASRTSSRRTLTGPQGWGRQPAIQAAGGSGGSPGPAVRRIRPRSATPTPCPPHDRPGPRPVPRAPLRPWRACRMPYVRSAAASAGANFEQILSVPLPGGYRAARRLPRGQAAHGAGPPCVLRWEHLPPWLPSRRPAAPGPEPRRRRAPGLLTPDVAPGGAPAARRQWVPCIDPLCLMRARPGGGWRSQARPTAAHIGCRRLQRLCSPPPWPDDLGAGLPGAARRGPAFPCASARRATPLPELHLLPAEQQGPSRALAVSPGLQPDAAVGGGARPAPGKERDDQQGGQTRTERAGAEDGQPGDGPGRPPSSAPLGGDRFSLLETAVEGASSGRRRAGGGRCRRPPRPLLGPVEEAMAGRASHVTASIRGRHPAPGHALVRRAGRAILARSSPRRGALPFWHDQGHLAEGRRVLARVAGPAPCGGALAPGRVNSSPVRWPGPRRLPARRPGSARAIWQEVASAAGHAESRLQRVDGRAGRSRRRQGALRGQPGRLPGPARPQGDSLVARPVRAPRPGPGGRRCSAGPCSEEAQPPD